MKFSQILKIQENDLFKVLLALLLVQDIVCTEKSKCVTAESTDLHQESFISCWAPEGSGRALGACSGSPLWPGPVSLVMGEQKHTGWDGLDNTT